MSASDLTFLPLNNPWILGDLRLFEDALAKNNDLNSGLFTTSNLLNPFKSLPHVVEGMQ